PSAMSGGVVKPVLSPGKSSVASPLRYHIDDGAEVEVTPKHIFGSSCSRGRSNLVYVDDVTVAYTAAHYVILYNTETKTQRLLPCHSGALGVTSMAVCPNKRFLAVAESFPAAFDHHSEASDGTPTAPTVAVYDLRCKGEAIRRRRILSIHPRTHEHSEAFGFFRPVVGIGDFGNYGCVTAISFPADGKSLITISTTPAAGS
ncbi:hypothetical protein FOZ63_001834, partial [Perkinsus olseni]